MTLIARFSYNRSEAKGVPHLLVAPRALPLDQDLVEEGIHSVDLDDQGGGYYADGAYTAAPKTDVLVSSDHEPPDAQDFYYERLSARFKLLHATLRCDPHLSAIESLSSSSLISLPPDIESAQSQWRLHLQSSDPLLVQLACMDSESVLEVIKILTGTMGQTVRSRSLDKISRFGAWAWGLLGKCRDRTELGSEEIAILRELGKRAVQLLVGIKDKIEQGYNVREEAAATVEDSGECEEQDDAKAMLIDEPVTDVVLGDGHGIDDTSPQKENLDPNGAASSRQGATALEMAKRRLESSFLAMETVQSPSADAMNGSAGDRLGMNKAKHILDVDQQTRMTLDMILTIVGESYGQRDLLELRDIWGEV